MSGTSKNGIMSFEGMVSEQEKSKGNRTYKADSLEVSTQAISRSVANALRELKQSESVVRVSLDDTDSIKLITEQYLLACSETGTLPTLGGLARCLGRTRQALYHHMRNKPNSPTTEWFETFKDMCSDLLSQNALMGNTHPIVSIFLQKACYGLRDNITIETVPADDSRRFDESTLAELRQRYGSLAEQEMQE